MCVSACRKSDVQACVSVDDRRPVLVLMRGVRDIRVGLCIVLPLCRLTHSDMSQATSWPHKRMSLGGGILMWKWEQWFYFETWTESIVHWTEYQKWCLNYCIYHHSVLCARCIWMGVCWYIYMSISFCAVMCPSWVFVSLLIHAYASTQVTLNGDTSRKSLILWVCMFACQWAWKEMVRKKQEKKEEKRRKKKLEKIKSYSTSLKNHYLLVYLLLKKTKHKTKMLIYMCNLYCQICEMIN